MANLHPMPFPYPCIERQLIASRPTLQDIIRQIAPMCFVVLQLAGGGGQLPQWATSLIIFGSCILVTTFVLVAGRIVHYIADRRAGKINMSDWWGCVVL